MNVYHISYAAEVKQAYLHFWECNMRCRACLCLKEIYDCHLEETRERIFREGGPPQSPQSFLEIKEIVKLLTGLNLETIFFMGMEPTVDSDLPDLARELHHLFETRHILLTNGLRLPSLENVDEVVISIKAVSNDLHLDYTGTTNIEALQNFRRVYEMGRKLMAESIFIPNYIDKEEIGRIAAFISSVDFSIPYRIDAYLPVGDNPWRRPTFEEMRGAQGEAQKHLTNVTFIAGNERLAFGVKRIY